MARPNEMLKSDETISSLERMQTFDTSLLPRERELGSLLNFNSAVAPAQKLIDFYKRISKHVVQEFPPSKLTELIQCANKDYAILKEIIDFQPGRPAQERDALLARLDQTYEETFNRLYNLISYSCSRSTDYGSLEEQARATMQTFRDMGEKLTAELENRRDEAGRVLELVRKAAAEQGVSQQAVYFREDAQEHEKQAQLWGRKVLMSACLLGAYAVGTLFLHKIRYLAPENSYQTVQMAISKVLIFGVLSYMVYLATRNYLAHKHNAIVNRHRQNALLTYRALVDAAKDLSNKEVVLTHASGCIFAPQPTGYTGGPALDGPSAKSVVELLTRATSSER